jgi:hypothetical protein
MAFARGSIVKRPLHGWYTRLSWILGVYWHMGIYIGEGMVVHFNGEKSSTNARVCSDSLEVFAAGERVVLHAGPRNIRHGEAICAEALRVLHHSNNSFNNHYSFPFNNCEDFCVACYEVDYASPEGVE